MGSGVELADSTVDVNGPRQRAARALTRWRRQVSWPVLGALVALTVVSSVAHVWALHRDLPVPDVDESAFLEPAVHIAATGDLNPHWFGHPGSTVIYPVAGLVHAWDALAHQGPILTSNAALTTRLQRSPTTFYVIGRLWTIALSVGALPLLFLLGRRAFNTRVALIAAAIWAVLPYPVHFGRMVRTDSAGVFFGLLSLSLCLRLLDEPRTRWSVLAGLSVGLAVSSRYFMVALLPVLVAAAVLPHRRALRPAVRSTGVALASAVGGFALTTPYFFLDWHTAHQSVQSETGTHLGASGFSHLGNLRWYLGTAIPHLLTWPLVALAAAGVVLVLWRPRARQLLLVGFCAVFLAGICLSKLHWDRWALEILPVLMLLAAFTVDTIAHRLATIRVARASIFAPVALVAVTGVLVIQPVAELADADVHPSTGSVAHDWIVSHLAPGTRIIEDSVNVPLDDRHFRVNYRFHPRSHSLAEYQRAGYEYLIVNKFLAHYYVFKFKSSPNQARFYLDVACGTSLVADFGLNFTFSSTRSGMPIRIYRLMQSPSHLHGFLCEQHVTN
jgi:hypothetical protein